MTDLDLLLVQLRAVEKTLKYNKSWVQHDHIVDKITDIKSEIMREINRLEKELVNLRAKLESAVCADQLEVIEDRIEGLESAITSAKLKL